VDEFTANLDYPMFVLTVPAQAGGRPSGCLVGFATQCSIAPPRFLFCVSKANHTFRALPGARRVGVHLLSNADRDLAELFGERTGDEVDKFRRCEWSAGDDGVPVLARCLSWFVGEVLDLVDLGDHMGLVLAPQRWGSREDGAPLMYSAIRDLSAGHPAE
jgi:flavin reductase (DIM6/NTAB) family NADH-FMN oxidoreductase RutF